MNILQFIFPCNSGPLGGFQFGDITHRLLWTFCVCFGEFIFKRIYLEQNHRGTGYFRFNFARSCQTPSQRFLYRFLFPQGCIFLHNLYLFVGSCNFKACSIKWGWPSFMCWYTHCSSERLYWLTDTDENASMCPGYLDFMFGEWSICWSFLSFFLSNLQWCVMYCGYYSFMSCVGKSFPNLWLVFSHCSWYINILLCSNISIFHLWLACFKFYFKKFHSFKVWIWLILPS